ncbi:unnamed protein product [Paramecium sonneborni]|uniref:Uncharacterized protein n=1 Tax=Paramecium sonneborni TaxID=65129 RepID=A0A8S1LQT6_9CILI|nr:unnamed protein product [Paramecium sonneborni]
MLTNEYLNKVTQLLKMTSHFETKLEEQRILLSITPHFQARTIYNLLITDSKGITRDDLINLFRNFIQNITQRELDYIFQLYSSDNFYINWDDFYQLICPFDMFLDTKIYDNVNEQIVSDILQKFQRLLMIEITYFRQAEPIRMILFEKYKENGKQSCALLEDNQKFITSQNLINFMQKQQFNYNSQDIFCLKKRIQCSEENIPSEIFIKNCPLLPFQVMISKSPDYRLITIRQPTPEIIQSPELLQSKSVGIIIQEIPSSPPQEQEEDKKMLQQVASVPFLKKSEMSNYEFYTGKKPDNTQTLQHFKPHSTQQNFKSPLPQSQNYHNINYQDFQITKQDNKFDYNKTITTVKFWETNPPTDIPKYQDQILDKYLRPSASIKNEPSKKKNIKKNYNNYYNNNKLEHYLQFQPNDQIVKIMDTQNDPSEDILNQYLYPIKKQQEQVQDSNNLTNTRKYKIFDDINSNQKQVLFNTLYDSKYKLFDSAFDSRNLNSQNQQQIQKKTKKYVTASKPQEQILLYIYFFINFFSWSQRSKQIQRKIDEIENLFLLLQNSNKKYSKLIVLFKNIQFVIYGIK